MKTIEQAINEVLAHSTSPDAEIRIARRLEIGRAIHQGDVYVRRVPDDHPRGAALGTRQVAVGEGVGSRHVAEGEGVEVFAGDPACAPALLPKMSGSRERRLCLGPVVVATGTWCLTHPKHAHHRLPAGTYQVTYQLDAKTRRAARD